MRSIFGWSLPPGCSTLPGEEPCGPCETCGGNVDADKCICPECPVCGASGDPSCYPAHGLIYTFAQLRGMACIVEFYRREAEQERLACAAEAEYWKDAERWQGEHIF